MTRGEMTQMKTKNNIVKINNTHVTVFLSWDRTLYYTLCSLVVELTLIWQKPVASSFFCEKGKCKC